MNMKRMRGRNHRPGNNGGGGGGGGFRNQQNGIPLNRNHVFDSSGPEMRVRGTAQQLHEKYTQMARDASSNGDRVTGEAYYQHAEHYFRIISAINQAQNANGQQAPQQGQQNGQANGYQNHENSGDTQEAVAEPRYQEPRAQEARYQEPRQQHEPRQYEPRQNGQQQEPRQQEPRRNEQRGFEQRNRPEFQRNERYRPEAPVADTRIDISSALEAELAAAAKPAGFGEQPVINHAAAPEPRAIPIIPDAPPPPEAEAAAAKIVKPRGRPRLAKTLGVKDGE